VETGLRIVWRQDSECVKFSMF